MPRVIVVEDDARTRASLVAELQDEGLEVDGFASVPRRRWQSCEAGRRTDLLLARRAAARDAAASISCATSPARRLPPTIVISGEATISETVEALRLGVYDFIEKPFSRERLRTSVRNALGRAALEGEVPRCARRSARRTCVGRSPR